MTRDEPNKPPLVPAGARQGGEHSGSCWDWVEDPVWTEQMLATLTKGTKGGKDINSWVRQRLRAILRRRSKRSGRPTVWDQKRWPNAFFINAGLQILRPDPQLKLPIQNLAF